MDILERAAASKSNYKKWELISYISFYEAFYDAKYEIYWLWYKNDGWGGCDWSETEEGLYEIAEEFDHTSW